MGIFNKRIQTPEGFGEHYIEVGNNWDYHCPKCGKDVPDDFGKPSEVNEYVKFYNYHTHYSDMGYFIYWDEYHICQECETKFWFQNGN